MMRSIWIIRLFALAGLLLSAYLAWTAFQDQTPLGCGAGGGCAEVLRSRWSTWFILPVTVPAASLFATLLGTTLFVGDAIPAGPRDAARWLVLVLCSVAAFSAVWFLGIQWFILRETCAFCLATHGCSLALVLATTVSGWWTAQRAIWSVGLGLLGLAVLAAGQWGARQTSSFVVTEYRPGGAADIIRLERHRDSARPPRAVQSRSFLGGRLLIDPDAAPCRGDPRATFIAAKMFDYACPHCRRLHQQLIALQADQQDLAILMLPAPLSPQCNPYVEIQDETNPDACLLARLAIAVWTIAPEKFPAFDDWLFQSVAPRSGAEARRRAAELVGSEELTSAMSSAETTQLMERLVEVYGRLEDGVLPTLMFPRAALSGQVENQAELQAVLVEHLRAKRP